VVLAIRMLRDGDLDVLAKLWFDGWQDAHADILPDPLREVRTLSSFRERLAARDNPVRVATLGDVPQGFAILKDDELYQFYVAAAARGSGLAGELMADALAMLREAGHARAWLACAIGNGRARRFYEKMGWELTGEITIELPTPDGGFPLDVWRLEIEP
jgi:GNAT superfamily N-acetyltransferase